MKRLALLAAALLLLPLLARSSNPVQAHALLVRADPPVNAQVREPPRVLTLYFSEPLERRFSSVRVLDQNNQRVDERFEFDDVDNALMRVHLRELQPGYITVLWETVSTVDGHRVSGSYPLTILNPDGSPPPGSPAVASVQTQGAEVRPDRVATKTVLLAAGAVLTGALAFLVLVTPALRGPGAGQATVAIERRGLLLALAALAVLLVAGMVELALQADDIGGGLGDALETRWGGRWLLRNLLLAVPLLASALLLVPGSSGGPRRFLAAVALVAATGYLAVVASVSHAAAGGGAFWAVLADFLHLLAASVWTGMLAMLAVLFWWSRDHLPRRDKHPVLSAALVRFSFIALVSVAALLFTGVVSAVIEIGAIGDLTSTAYGRTLLLKLVLILPLLAVGGFNAYYLRPRLVEAADDGRGQQPIVEEKEQQLSRSVRYELAIAALVLAAAALLSQTSPTRGRLAAPDLAGPFTETMTDGRVSATLVIDPNQPGVNTFEVYLAGAVETVESVSLRFRQGSGAEARLIMEPSNPPTFYVGQGPYLSQPGTWTVGVDLRRSIGNDLLLPFEVKLADAGALVGSPRSGGAFASPLPPSLPALALVAAAALLAVALVVGSLRPAEVDGGYLSLLADEVFSRIDLSGLRPAWSLAALVVMGIGLGLLLGSHLHNRLSPEEASRNNPVPPTPESIARGRMLFVQNCISCHGETGRGDGPLAAMLPLPPANLYDHVPYHPDQFFYNVITRGIGGIMPAFGNTISEEDRWNILNFLRDQFGQPAPVQ